MPHVRLSISIPDDLVSKLQARALAEDRSVSSLITHLIRPGLSPVKPHQVVSPAPQHHHDDEEVVVLPTGVPPRPLTDRDFV